MKQKISYSYSDIVLLPDYSEIRSRRDADCNQTFLGRIFKSVAIPANMKCTIDFKMAGILSEEDYFYVLHRFYPYSDILKWITDNQNLKTISISIGVKEEDYRLISAIKNNNLRVDFITIDVAHGHHISVKDILEYIKDELGSNNTKIIAGNIGTRRALDDLQQWGADAVKVGLSMGKSCTTYNCTGVGTPMFTTVRNVWFNDVDIYDASIPIIADGQIREVGDVCKALVAGASMVMIGSEFAKCSDSPAEVIDNHKIFFGSASSFNKNSDSFIEGQKVLLEQRTETYLQYFKRINEGIQSCMSYAGTNTLNGLRYMDYTIRT
jgi:GMP reductase